MDGSNIGEAIVPNLGNYSEYGPQLRAIFQSAADTGDALYLSLKEAVKAGTITVNTNYLPANCKIFAIVFYHKDLSETVIRAIVGEDINIADPLVEHQNDILKAIESSIRVDVFLKDVDTNRIYTLDMHRAYLKTRNRNRSVYYGAKELSSQEVSDGRYEKLRQVSITFIHENNTTPRSQALAKIQFKNVETNEVYTDLLTLYEFNLNAETNSEALPETLVILRSYLSIKTHEDLCAFMETYDTWFSRRLITEYMHAIVDDELLIKIEGSERYMTKAIEELLLEERMEGIKEGKEEGITIGKEEGITIGKEEGITIGKEEGITIGKEQGITIGKEQGIIIGKEEGKEEGIAIGEERGKKQGISKGLIMSIKVISALKENEPVESIAERFKISVEDIMQIQSTLPEILGLTA